MHVLFLILTFTGSSTTKRNQIYLLQSQTTRFDSRAGKVIEDRQIWGISALTASPGLHIAFPLSAEWKNESAGVGAADVCAAAVIWWRFFFGGVTAQCWRWECATVRLYLIYLPPRLPAFTEDGNQALLTRGSFILSPCSSPLLFY